MSKQQQIFGVRSAQREVWVLQVIACDDNNIEHYNKYSEHGDFTHLFKIEEAGKGLDFIENATPPGIPFLFMLYGILIDLEALELVEIKLEKRTGPNLWAWAKVRITDKGRQLLASYE